MTSYVIRNAALLGGDAVDLLLDNGTVAGIGTGLRAPDATEVDATGLVALPGLVDLHTHLREPGREDAETVATGTAAAARGGYTAVHAMANTDPVADTAGVVEQVWRLGRDAGHCEVRPVGAVTVGLGGERLAELGAMADSAARVRVFSDDGKCVWDAVLMRRALEYVKAFDGVIAQHAQEPRLTEGAQMNEGDLSGVLGLQGWPAVAEEAIIARDVLLSGHVGSRLHICHVSTAGSVELIRWAKSKGWAVTAEVTPHHLLLTDELATTYDPIYKVNPPLRSAADVEAVRAGLADGTIDAVATDHAPHPMEDKECGGRRRPSGCSAWRRRCRSVQGRWSTPPPGRAGVADRMSTRRRPIGRVIGQGRPVAVGEPAHLVLYDPAARTRCARPRARPCRATTPTPGGRCPAAWSPPSSPDARPCSTGAFKGPAPMRSGPGHDPAGRSDAVRVLEDGRAFHGHAYGARGQTVARRCFATGIPLPETLTDPSYRRQVVVMTAPHIGNTGMNDEDPESRRIWVAGYVVRDPAAVTSSWRSRRDLGAELPPPGWSGSAGSTPGADPAPARARGDAGRHLLGVRRHRRPADAGAGGAADEGPGAGVGGDDRARVRRPAPGRQRFTVAALDLGIKTMTPRLMSRRGIEVHVLPATSTFADVRATGADGLFFSNGPGDPAATTAEVELLQQALSAGLPYFGICFGNQLFGSALGLGTFKLRYGHRGINSPVKDLRTGRVEVTAHNHGFAVRWPTDDLTVPVGTPFGTATVSHVCLNDDVVEGLELRSPEGRLTGFSVQYHPESAAGPHDAEYLFDRFAGLLGASSEVPA
jgi:dihydroorotase